MKSEQTQGVCPCRVSHHFHEWKIWRTRLFYESVLSNTIPEKSKRESPVHLVFGLVHSHSSFLHWVLLEGQSWGRKKESWDPKPFNKRSPWMHTCHPGRRNLGCRDIPRVRKGMKPMLSEAGIDPYWLGSQNRRLEPLGQSEASHTYKPTAAVTHPPQGSHISSHPHLTQTTACNIWSKPQEHVYPENTATSTRLQNPKIQHHRKPRCYKWSQ